MRPGGMSDLTIPEQDPPPPDCTCSSRQACYCYDNGHTPTRDGSMCLACGQQL